MPKTRQQKEALLVELVDHAKNRKSAAIADFTGLTVADTEELRNKCKAEEVEFIAVKKTLLKKALTDAGLSLDPITFDGSLAIAFSDGDEVAPARILYEFAKDHENVQLRGGIMEGETVAEGEIKALAVLPSKPELYAKIVGSLNAPISGFVNVLAGNMRGLVNVLNAIKETK